MLNSETISAMPWREISNNFLVIIVAVTILWFLTPCVVREFVRIIRIVKRKNG
jgi:hypothetical protein